MGKKLAKRLVQISLNTNDLSLYQLCPRRSINSQNEIYDIQCMISFGIFNTNDVPHTSFTKVSMSGSGMHAIWEPNNLLYTSTIASLSLQQVDIHGLGGSSIQDVALIGRMPVILLQIFTCMLTCHNAISYHISF